MIDEKGGSGEVNTLLGVKEAVEQPLIILWEKLEEWQQDNHYIHSGYRPATNSYKKSIASLTYLHTESVNIWSHVIGAAIFALSGPVLYLVLKQRYEEASSTDFSVFLCFFVGAIVCMGMSATFHTITNHSLTVSKLGNQLDYFGIVFLIVGSFIPSIYYGFACDPPLITTYWTMIITIGAGCGITTFSPKFASPKWRPFRASMFIAMGLSAIFPVIHGLKLYGLDRMVGLIGLPWLVSQGAMYVLGALLYAVSVNRSRRVPYQLTHSTIDARAGAVQARTLRYLGRIAPDFPFSCCCCGCHSFGWPGKGVRLSLQQLGARIVSRISNMRPLPC